MSGTALSGEAATRRITAVLACHGRVATTLAGLTALFDQTLPPGVMLEAVVVDDGSDDGTADAVATRFPQVRLLHGDGSLWWAGAMARGLVEAAHSRPDFLLWLNDDVCLDEGALAALLACHDGWCDETGQAPIVVGATRDPDTGLGSYGGQRRHPRRPFRFLPVTPAADPQLCDTFQGNVVLVPGSVHERLGGIPAIFSGVQGMADTDFGLRAGQAGIAVVQAPGLVGACTLNRAVAAWRDERLTRRARVAALFGPRGFPPQAWFAFARRHGGPVWPLWAVSPYLFRIPAALMARGRTPSCDDRCRNGAAGENTVGDITVGDITVAKGRPRVALMDGIMTHYRLPFLRELARMDDFAFTVFNGPAPPNHTAVMTDEPLPLPVLPVRHRSIPGGTRILWTGGVMEALSGRYDAVITVGHVHDLGVWVLWLARRLTGRPRLILSGHFRLKGEGSGPIAGLRGWLRTVMARGADALLVYTPRFGAQCVAHGIPADRVFVTHNTIDVAAVRDASAEIGPDDLMAARKRHGLPEAGPVFLFVGRLYAGKRVDVAIAAISALRRRGHACTLLVVGDGPDQPRIKTLADEAEGVILIPALFKESELAPLFRIATAVVCPDSVGLLIAHAFAYGVPIVACRGAPGHGVEIDYLEHGGNGLFADDVEAESLAATLERLLSEPGLADHLAAGARQTADGLGVGTMADANFAALYRALANRPRKTNSPSA